MPAANSKKTDKKSAAPKTAAKATPAKAKAPAAPKAKKAPVAKPAAKASAAPAKTAKAARPPVSVDQRRHYVEVAAYYIAERRGFDGGDALGDWAAAEAEIDRLLAEGLLNA